MPSPRSDPALFRNYPLLLTLVVIALSAGPLWAATITVNTLSDTFDPFACSFRDAITAANIDGQWASCTAGFGTDLIVFDEQLQGGIVLTSHMAFITEDLNIEGPEDRFIFIDGDNMFRTLTFHEVEGSAKNLTLASGTHSSRGGCIDAARSILTLHNVALTGCAAPTGGALGLLETEATLVNVFVGNSAADQGGGLYALGSRVEIEDSLFFNNSGTCPMSPCSTVGGGAYFFANLPGSFVSTIRRTTFRGNASGDGSAIFVGINTSVTMEYSTVSENMLLAGGPIDNGAVAVEGSLQLLSTIIASNNMVSQHPDVANSGTLTSLGYNLIGNNQGASVVFPAGQPNGNLDLVGTDVAPLDPALVYGDHGGPLDTFLPQAGSPAIDQGSCLAETADQRGFLNLDTGLRIVDDPLVGNQIDGCDIGSVEVGAEDPVLIFQDGFESGDLQAWTVQ